MYNEIAGLINLRGTKMFDLLLNPNVAYLLLVAGLWMIMLAIVSPGSGIFELGAVIALLLAAWGVVNLPINYWALALLVMGIIPFILAVFKSRRVIYLILSIIAMVIGSSFLFKGEGWMPAVNPILAVLTSTATGGYFWLVTRNALELRRTLPPHDLARLVGAIGETQSPILDEGTVHVMGELWTARQANPTGEEIPARAKVRVVGRQGFVLMVEPFERKGNSGQGVHNE